jgi:hypothetical protein
MKIKFVLGVIILLTSCYTPSTAQNSDNALLDAYQNTQSNVSTDKDPNLYIPMYIKNDSTYFFEKVGSKMESKAIGMGYGGMNSYYTIFNSPTSSVRFKQNEIPTFIITVDPGTDVFEMILIVKADVVKNKTYRRFVKSGVAAGGSKDMSAYQIKPELKQLDKNKYQIVLPPLAAGEYAFMPIFKGTQGQSIRTASGSIRLFCFGIN